MSIFKKQRGNRSYVYFQLYGGSRRKVEYLGLENQLSTWEKAERLFLGYLDKRLADFYSQIPDELRSRIQPKEERRRLLEAGKPQAKIEDPIDVLVKSIPREQYPKVTEELRKNYVKLRAEQLGVSPEDFERGLAKFEYQAKPIAHKDSKRGK